MKLLIILCLFFSFTISAQNSSTETKKLDTVESLVKNKTKKERKKKVEICGECGKPEVDCKCHD